MNNEKLRSARRYLLVGIDPCSLLTLAVPVYVSDELAPIIGRLAGR